MSVDDQHGIELAQVSFTLTLFFCLCIYIYTVLLCITIHVCIFDIVNLISL
jgi:hypothetical protein